jgi:predicted helicase
MDDVEHLRARTAPPRASARPSVEQLLTDYKVLVLAVDQKYVDKTFQKQLADKNNELNLEDATKITGCWNGLEKHFEAATSNVDLQGDVNPMRRPSPSHDRSRTARSLWSSSTRSSRLTKRITLILNRWRSKPITWTARSTALRRGALLDWLKAESPANTCRILSNARCLSEGVDVPALDSVLFLNPRNSVIDVVQSVGRVMRRAEGKRYGYIILPIGIPPTRRPKKPSKTTKSTKSSGRCSRPSGPTTTASTPPSIRSS